MSPGLTVRRLTLTSGRFAMIDNGLGFQLVPWSPNLERSLVSMSRASRGRWRDRMGLRAEAGAWDLEGVVSPLHSRAAKPPGLGRPFNLNPPFPFIRPSSRELGCYLGLAFKTRSDNDRAFSARQVTRPTNSHEPSLSQPPGYAKLFGPPRSYTSGPHHDVADQHRKVLQARSV